MPILNIPVKEWGADMADQAKRKAEEAMRKIKEEGGAAVAETQRQAKEARDAWMREQIEAAMAPIREAGHTAAEGLSALGGIKNDLGAGLQQSVAAQGAMDQTSQETAAREAAQAPPSPLDQPAPELSPLNIPGVRAAGEGFANLGQAVSETPVGEAWTAAQQAQGGMEQAARGTTERERGQTYAQPGELLGPPEEEAPGPTPYFVAPTTGTREGEAQTSELAKTAMENTPGGKFMTDFTRAASSNAPEMSADTPVENLTTMAGLGVQNVGAPLPTRFGQAIPGGQAALQPVASAVMKAIPGGETPINPNVDPNTPALGGLLTPDEAIPLAVGALTDPDNIVGLANRARGFQVPGAVKRAAGEVSSRLDAAGRAAMDDGKMGILAGQTPGLPAEEGYRYIGVPESTLENVSEYGNISAGKLAQNDPDLALSDVVGVSERGDRGALLRVKAQDAAPYQEGPYTLTGRDVPAEQLEVRGDDGQWHPAKGFTERPDYGIPSAEQMGGASPQGEGGPLFPGAPPHGPEGPPIPTDQAGIGRPDARRAVAQDMGQDVSHFSDDELRRMSTEEWSEALDQAPPLQSAPPEDVGHVLDTARRVIDETPLPGDETRVRLPSDPGEMGRLRQGQEEGTLPDNETIRQIGEALDARKARQRTLGQRRANLDRAGIKTNIPDNDLARMSDDEFGEFLVNESDEFGGVADDLDDLDDDISPEDQRALWERFNGPPGGMPPEPPEPPTFRAPGSEPDPTKGWPEMHRPSTGRDLSSGPTPEGSRGSFPDPHGEQARPPGAEDVPEGTLPARFPRPMGPPSPTFPDPHDVGKRGYGEVNTRDLDKSFWDGDMDQAFTEDHVRAIHLAIENGEIGTDADPTNREVLEWVQENLAPKPWAKEARLPDNGSGPYLKENDPAYQNDPDYVDYPDPTRHQQGLDRMEELRAAGIDLGQFEGLSMEEVGGLSRADFEEWKSALTEPPRPPLQRASERAPSSTPTPPDDWQVDPEQFNGLGGWAKRRRDHAAARGQNLDHLSDEEVFEIPGDKWREMFPPEPGLGAARRAEADAANYRFEGISDDELADMDDATWADMRREFHMTQEEKDDYFYGGSDYPGQKLPKGWAENEAAGRARRKLARDAGREVGWLPDDELGRLTDEQFQRVITDPDYRPTIDPRMSVEDARKRLESLPDDETAFGMPDADELGPGPRPGESLEDYAARLREQDPLGTRESFDPMQGPQTPPPPDPRLRPGEIEARPIGPVEPPTNEGPPPPGNWHTPLGSNKLPDVGDLGPERSNFVPPRPRSITDQLLGRGANAVLGGVEANQRTDEDAPIEERLRNIGVRALGGALQPPGRPGAVARALVRGAPRLADDLLGAAEGGAPRGRPRKYTPEMRTPPSREPVDYGDKLRPLESYPKEMVAEEVMQVAKMAGDRINELRDMARGLPEGPQRDAIEAAAKNYQNTFIGGLKGRMTPEEKARLNMEYALERQGQPRPESRAVHPGAPGTPAPSEDVPEPPGSRQVDPGTPSGSGKTGRWVQNTEPEARSRLPSPGQQDLPVDMPGELPLREGLSDPDLTPEQRATAETLGKREAADVAVRRFRAEERVRAAEAQARRDAAVRARQEANVPVPPNTLVDQPPLEIETTTGQRRLGEEGPPLTPEQEAVAKKLATPEDPNEPIPASRHTDLNRGDRQMRDKMVRDAVDGGYPMIAAVRKVDEAFDALKEARSKMDRPRLGNWLNTIRYGFGLLANPVTAAADFVASQAEVPWGYARDELLSIGNKGRRSVLAAEREGLKKGYKSGFKDMGEIFTTGKELRELRPGAAEEDAPESLMRRYDRLGQRNWSRAAGFVEGATRGRNAIDAVSHGAIYTSQIYKEAAQSVNKTTTNAPQSEAWWQEVQAFVNKTAEPKLSENTPEFAARKRALLSADRALGRNDPGHLAGYLGLAFQNPLMRPFFPLFRTGYNISVRGMERSPLGAIGILYDKALGREVSAERVMDMAMGSTITVPMALYAAQTGNITGYGPNDQKTREDLMAEGWRPFSIRTPDGRYHSYTRLGAAAAPLAMAGAIGDARRFHEVDESGGQVMAHAGGNFGQWFGNQFLLRSLGNIQDVFTDPGGELPAFAGRTVGQYAGIGTGTGALAGALDPYQRETDTGGVNPFFNEMIKNVPVLRHNVLDPKYDVTGKPLPNPGYGPGALWPYTAGPVERRGQRRFFDSPSAEEDSRIASAIEEVRAYLQGKSDENPGAEAWRLHDEYVGMADPDYTMLRTEAKEAETERVASRARRLAG